MYSNITTLVYQTHILFLLNTEQLKSNLEFGAPQIPGKHCTRKTAEQMQDFTARRMSMLSTLGRSALSENHVISLAIRNTRGGHLVIYSARQIS